MVDSVVLSIANPSNTSMMSPMELLSTREAAALAGVGTSAVKRWADAGRLPCVKTAGGHRRFERAAVEHMMHGGDATDLAIPATDPTRAWLELLLGASEEGIALEARLLDERATRGSWSAVAEFLGGVLGGLGERWASGAISVLEEHQASERLERALARIVATIPVGRAAPTALLLTATGDEHTLGLSLVEVVLRELGWRTRWAGRGTPDQDVVAAVAMGGIAMVAVSASEWSTDRRALARQLGVVGKACAQHRVRLLVGGRGAWPDKPALAVRCHDFASLRRAAAPRRGAR
jgi:excisionase family DNA binding protein